MTPLDPIDAHLAMLNWGRWDAANPPEIVHAVVPRDFSDDSMPLAVLQRNPREWHAVVNNLVMEADQKFGHRRWFDMQSPWHGLISGADSSAFYAYQNASDDTRDRIATIRCYPDGTLISRSWIVAPHLAPPRKVIAIEEIADSLAATLWFALNLHATVAPDKPREIIVRSALASAQDLKLLFQAGETPFQAVQIEPDAFLRVPGELVLRWPDGQLDSRIRSLASPQRCLDRIGPLYRGDQA